MSWFAVCLVICCMQHLATGGSTLDPRCNEETLLFAHPPSVKAPYYREITRHPPVQEDGSLFFFQRKDDSDGYHIPKRPLFGTVYVRSDPETKKEYFDRSHMITADLCNKDNVAMQLQTAIELEWATIPVYLTSLFSIIDGPSGLNKKIYTSIKQIIIDEMHHMNLACNMLISLNETYPVIDDKNSTPHFPTTGLPGGVLASLQIDLDKLTLEQVQKVFMGIEVPEETDVVEPQECIDCFTIGMFYHEISDCMELLNTTGVQIFDPSTSTNQVLNIFGDKPIVDTDSARTAIKLIVDQGEGAGLIDPYTFSGSDSLAHFFRFEEVVCQRKLVNHDNITYSYTGDEITYDESGVYPVPKNFDVTKVPKDSACYSKAEEFHTEYRNLIQLLQESFSGQPDTLDKALHAMGSLTGIANDLVKIPINSTENCGPVWEYEWPGSE